MTKSKTATLAWVSCRNYTQHQLLHPTAKEVYDLKERPSQTVPGMSMGLQDLLTRFGQGRSIRLNTGYFDKDGEPDFDLSKIDKMEMEEMKHQNRKRISTLKRQLNRLTSEKQIEEAEASLKDAEKETDLLEALRQKLFPPEKPVEAPKTDEK